MMVAEIVTERGLHYVLGLPRFLEWGLRGLTFVLAVVCAGMLIGMLTERRSIHRGLWWVALACLLFCLRSMLVQYERWDAPITVEAALTLPILLALAWGMRLRLRDGSIGR